MIRFLQDREHKFHGAVSRLQMKISFKAHDFYAVDVFYHNSCCIKFAIKKKVTVNTDEQMENLQNDILEEFLLGLKKRVIHQKEVFLLSDLLDEIKKLSTGNKSENALITNTRALKREISEQFPDCVSYYNKAKYLILHCSHMNPCEYAIAVLKD